MSHEERLRLLPEDNPDTARPGTSYESSSAVTIDQAPETPLYSASQAGNVDRVKELLTRGTDISDADVNSAFEIAMKNDHSDVASVIIGSEKWKAALKNNRPIRHGKLDTPLHRLVVQMPDVAEQVFERCVTTSKGQSNPLDEYNYEFFDDAYIDSESDGNRQAKVRCTLNDAYNAKSTNLLSLMVKHPRSRLLNHPLVLGLIKHKMTKAVFVCFLFLAYYTIFTMLIVLYLERGNFTCDGLTNLTTPTNERTTQTLLSIHIPRTAPCTSVGVGIFIAMIQLYVTKVKYFTNLTNYLDCFTYLLAILILIDFSGCGILLEWQQQLGGLFIFVAMINLTRRLRIVPLIGIYTAMLWSVVKTLVVCFFGFLFVIEAFTESFLLLLQGQASFDTEGHAMAKTWVMMTGELDFENMFFGDHGDTATRPKVAAFIVFVLFLLLCVTAINNVMIGLAVSDVARLKQEAEFKQARTAAELLLDYELNMPSWVLRNSGFYIRTRTLTVDPSTSKSTCSQLVKFVLRPWDFSLQPIKYHRSDSSKMMEKMADAELQHSKDMSKMMEKMAAIELQLQEFTKQVVKGRLQTSTSMPEFVTPREAESYHE